MYWYSRAQHSSYRMTSRKPQPVPVPQLLPPAERTLLRTTVREKIRAAILDGTLLPGERLHDDELTAWLGVSRTPVREALNDLTRAGLVEMAPNRYTRVALPTVGDIVNATQTLGVLFGGAVRLAVPLLDEATKKIAYGLIDAAIDDVRRSDAAALNLDTVRLYDTYVENCGNPLLIDVCRSTTDGLAFKLRVPEIQEMLDWAHYESWFTDLRVATEKGDGIAAELATEALHGLPGVRAAISS
jgi:DNA-binding GntR family transcriptional regulator